MNLTIVNIFRLAADDPNLKAGILSLANLLKIPEHDDPLLRLHVSENIDMFFSPVLIPNSN